MRGDDRNDGGSDNRCQWHGQGGHYEVWYLTGNDRASGTGYWIRYTLEAPLPGHGTPYAQLWFAYFSADDPGRNLAVNQILSIEDLSTTDRPFRVEMGAAELSDEHARGAIQGGDHAVSWDLSWRPARATHRHLPPIMYRRGGLGETTVLSPNLDVGVSGVITVNGRRHELVEQPFGQTHLWGRKHAHAWAWGHCNAFAERPDAALETLSVNLKRGGLLLPRLTVFTLYLDGRAHRFNHFHQTLLTSATIGSTSYEFRGVGARFRIEGRFQARPEDMVVARYADPDGAPSFCSNTEVANLELTVHERRGLRGWREYAHLVAPGSGHFEIGARVRDPRIEADHLTI